MMDKDHVRLADAVAAQLEAEIRELPSRFFDSFSFTQTGNNLTHPIMLGLLTGIIRSLPGVRYVGCDTRLNEGRGAKFQPDLVGYDPLLNPLMVLDAESPNSSDARIPLKDVDPYIAWRRASGFAIPYVIVTTLPDYPSPAWELRYTSAGYPNVAFAGRLEEIARNPYQFWAAFYRAEFSDRDMDKIAWLNVSGHKVIRAWTE